MKVISSEEWRVIPGYSMYEVSNLGRVRSFSKKKKGALLSPGKDNLGYLFVNLMGEHRNQGVLRIHFLVMLTFVGPRPKGEHIIHLDKNKQNNSLLNLMYVSREKENLHRLKPNGSRSSRLGVIDRQQYRLLWILIHELLLFR